MRQISISVATYAAIWSARKPGEDSEDAVLRRTFGVSPDAEGTSSGQMGEAGDYIDPRFGVQLPEGFEVFRSHRGKHYRAKVVAGTLQLANDGKQYRSFNQLSNAIGARTENAWRSWYYTAPDGQRHLILQLRQQKPALLIDNAREGTDGRDVTAGNSTLADSRNPPSESLENSAKTSC